MSDLKHHFDFGADDALEFEGSLLAEYKWKDPCFFARAYKTKGNHLILMTGVSEPTWWSSVSISELERAASRGFVARLFRGDERRALFDIADKLFAISLHICICYKPQFLNLVLSKLGLEPECLVTVE